MRIIMKKIGGAFSLFMPPLMVKAWRRLVPLTDFQGDYDSYEHALSTCGNFYDEKSTAESMARKAAAWREGFQRSPVRDDLLVHFMATLFCAKITRETYDVNTLRVLDYGGGMGKFYFACKPFFPKSLRIVWDIVETPICCEVAGKHFTGGVMRFYNDINLNP